MTLLIILKIYLIFFVHTKKVLLRQLVLPNIINWRLVSETWKKGWIYIYLLFIYIYLLFIYIYYLFIFIK